MKKLKLKKAQMGTIAPTVDTEIGLAGIGKVKDKNLLPPPPNQSVQQGQSPYPRQANFWEQPLTLNWNHILASQVVQGIASAASNSSENSYENATLKYNQTIPPTSWLPQNPNTSNQALYGMQEGGSIIESYIQEFLFKERPKKEDSKSSKSSKNEKTVTESDIEEMMPEAVEEEQFPLNRSWDRISKILGPEFTEDAWKEYQAGGMPNVQKSNSAIEDILTSLEYMKNVKVKKNGDVRALIPMEDYTEALELVFDKFKDVKRSGQPYVKVWGKADKIKAGIEAAKNYMPKAKEMQQGGRLPIITDNPKDPRLKAYQDSLLNYKEGIRMQQELKREFGWEDIPITSSEDRFVGRLMVNAGLYGFKGNKNMKPIAYNDTTDMPLPMFKKPVQPVVYRKKEEFVRPKPERGNMITPEIAQSQMDLSNAKPISNDVQKTEFSYTYRDENSPNKQKTVYFPNWKAWNEFVQTQPFIDAPTNAAKTYGHATGHALKLQEGGLVNTTGYTKGSETEDNPVNIIPSGTITMANVYSPVVALPVKGNKTQEPVVMQPGADYTFDADHTIEFKAGGTYEVDESQLEMLKKLGYEVEIL